MQERQRARSAACSVGNVLFLLFLVAGPKAAEAAPQPCSGDGDGNQHAGGSVSRGGGEGAQAKEPRLGTSGRILGQGGCSLIQCFFIPFTGVNTAIGTKCSVTAYTTLKQTAGREAFYEFFLLTHEYPGTPDSLGKIPYKLYETMVKRAFCFLCHFYLRPDAS